MSARGKTRRVRPLLLVLLWIWVVAVAVVVDMFWNVDEFDGIRPRARLYRGMRTAGHKMVGVPVEEEHHAVLRWRGRLLLEAKTPDDVRAIVTFCRQAGHSDAPALRKVALTAEDPLAVGNAMRALGRLRRVARDAELVALLGDERSRVRHETVLALGASGDPSAVGALEPLLGDKDATTGTAKPGSVNRAKTRRRRAERQKARNRIAKLESDIEEFEARLSELSEELSKDPAGDWERLNRLANEEQELRRRLERRYAEWERLSKVLESD